MSESRRAAGTRGEDLALRYLTQRGYCLRDRNFRFRRGEIDLIVEAPEGDLVFVEVKARRSASAGDPAEWVTPRKQRQLQKLAQGYCLQHGEAQRPMRFDVIGIDLDREAGGAEIRHIPHAFLPEAAAYYT